MKHKILFIKICLLNVSFDNIKFVALYIFICIFSDKIAENIAWFIF